MYVVIINYEIYEQNENQCFDFIICAGCMANGSTLL